MLKIILGKIAVTVMFSFSLFACSAIGNVNNSVNNIKPEENYAYPIITDQFENSNDKNNGGYILPYINIPTPSSNSSVVYGQILILSEGDAPYLAPSLYLGKLLRPSDEVSESLFLVSISIDEDPKAEQATDGSFVFSDVPEGQYALTIWMPTSTFIFKDAKTNEPVIFDVIAGETLDLGTLYVP